MLSRVAESIYWMSRYIERAENVARFLMVSTNLNLDNVPATGREANSQWWPLVIAAGDDQAYLDRFGTFSRAKVIEFLTFDESNPNSIASCLSAARENARCVRESISGEMWQHINRFYLMAHEAASEESHVANPFRFFSQASQFGQQFVGVTDSTMTHGEPWQFCQLGRMLERADKTTRILDVKYFMLLPSPEDVGTNIDVIQWSALLRSASAFEMYQQRFGTISPTHIVNFLVFDKLFPRAVRHCLMHVESALASIVGGTPESDQQTSLVLRSLLCHLEEIDAEGVVEAGMHEFIAELQDGLNRIGTKLNSAFFVPWNAAA